ncbi:MAG: O-antigen ligase family protein [Acidobacteriota bacterium]
MFQHGHLDPKVLLFWASAALLGLLMLFLPLPFASVVPWAQTVLQLTAFLLLAAAAATSPRSASLSATWPAAFLAAISLLALVQAASWSAAIVRGISPQHAALASSAGELLGRVELPRVALSLAPSVSRSAALTWVAVAASLLAAAWLGTSRSVRRALAATLLAAALFQVFLGAWRLANEPAVIWGVAVPGSATRLRGTFVNADHLAVYLEMALAVAFAWGWWAWRRAQATQTLERRILYLGPPALVWLTLFTGLAFTGSRAGLAAAIAGALAQGTLLALRRRRWRLGASGVLVTVAGLGAVAFAGLEQGLGRWLATSPYEVAWNVRLAVYRSAFELWQRFPLTGSGLATFREAFALVAGKDSGDGTYFHAHNDYLELLVTTGAIGTLLVASGVAVALIGLGRGLENGARSEDRAAALAALGAWAAIAVHSCFDFGLSMPAISATLAVLTGAALAAGARHSHAEAGSAV